MYTLPDIAGDDTVHELGAPADGARASWVQFVVRGTGTVRIGGSETTSTRGVPVDAGGAWDLPWRGALSVYPLDQIRAYIPTGATLVVGYVV